MPAEIINLTLSGRETPARLPALLNPASRSANAQVDPFLPPDYLEAKKTFDVSPAARGSADAVSAQQHAVQEDEIIVLELADGSTFISSAKKLKETLALTHPELLGPDGEILLEKLRVEGVATRGFIGAAVGGLVSKVFTLVVGKTQDTIIKEALEKLGSPAELGVTWLGTKLLMKAIESKLDQKPGLYRWQRARGSATDLVAAQFKPMSAGDLQKNPMLIFIHGTASSTLGSFGDLRAAGAEFWAALDRQYPGGIFALEHRTFSESPIENALLLVEALPQGAHISLVSHSRGGLVADLLCLGDFGGLIDNFKHAFEGTGDADPAETARVLKELETAHAEHRAQLLKLASALQNKQLVVERYVRAASPAQGTRLLSANLDLFLSGLLTLIGQVPFLFGNPLYSMVKRIVIEIVRNRTSPHLVPGIEAMLPDSPMAKFLRDAPVRDGIKMALIAGDIQGGNLLQRLGVLLTDFLLFDNFDNDLVVDTAAMLSGIAAKTQARVLFDRGAEVSHFRYFTNLDTRTALRDWLVSADTTQLELFHALPDSFVSLDVLGVRGSQPVSNPNLPIVVMLPGVMGSYLTVNGVGRVWFDMVDLIGGGITRLAWGQPGVEAEQLWDKYYGDACVHLSKTHQVRRFPYDWRLPLDVLGERLGEFLDGLLKESKQPIRLLAHSMGGLVVRACIYQRRAVMDKLMQREGARLVMLGTPNQGAYSMVENLLGKGSSLRALITLDVTNDMQEVLDIVAGFRGALQLLPKPGFKDMFQGQPEGGELFEFQDPATWVKLNGKVRDFWFGNNKSAKPTQEQLDGASWLWQQDKKLAEKSSSDTPALPKDYEKNTTYIFGIARNTPCGVREHGGRLKMVGTTRGDGTVTWESGRIGGIGHFYYMPAAHGDLLASEDYFPSLSDLLSSGVPGKLLSSPPTTRDIQQAVPVTYDAGPPQADDADAIGRKLMGGSLRNRLQPRAKRHLEIAVKGMDLRFVTQPIMVGHYEQDPIAGPQALIDRELLDGALRERHSLGLYAGPRGTAVVVLRVPNELERQRGSLTGAVVTGLGTYDGTLSVSELTEAVRTGTLRYLLQIVDMFGKEDREVSLASLLLGQNSVANLSVAASVEALVRGVLEANARFAETTRLNIRVNRLDILELYVDTAITAVYALRETVRKLSAQAARHDTQLLCRGELEHSDSARRRLFDNSNSSYWPRLIVTDADRRDDECPSPDYLAVGAAGPDSAAATNPATAQLPRSGLADRLRFLYVAQRARAESVVQQRQPGLVEMLVNQQISSPRWNEDFGRMLFQLLVPHDFKDAARQLERLVLVVDSYTANLPWELMLADNPDAADADKLPLALRTPVVRQLSSTRFRRHVRQAMQRNALVIGNPSVHGFAAAFSTPQATLAADPLALPGAQTEAEAVASLLTGLDYTVLQAIGETSQASDVLAQLYRQPYRILHISAHGVFDMLHRDGRRRSGVVLSDGLLITAAEIKAMETVPELVFLNCCHLGQVDGVRDGNKLAASVARELIDIGVRCVIVAGWAVDDAGANVFGQTFYEQLLQHGQPFGEAVFAARKQVWEANPDDITWGAFQAYGEPGWLAQPGGNSGAGDAELYVSPEELLDALASMRANLSRKRDLQNEREMLAQIADIEQLLEKRCPPGWRTLPELQSALAATWRDFGHFEAARTAYLAAIQAEDRAGRVPIRDIEQLANVEAHLGEQRAAEELRTLSQLAESGTPSDVAAPGAEQKHESASGTVKQESGEALIQMALTRLKRLDQLVAAQGDEPPVAASSVVAAPPELTDLNQVSVESHATELISGRVFHAERSALTGSAFKRLASVKARYMLSGHLPPAAQEQASQEMLAALQHSVVAYQQAEGGSGNGRFAPYNMLNRLALDALTPWHDPANREAAIALAQKCGQAAAQAYAQSPSLWNAVMQGEALLVERLLDGSLGRTVDAGQATENEVTQAYQDAMANITIKPAQLDSVLTQLELLARFCAALALIPKVDSPLSVSGPALQRMAERLLKLVQVLQPGRESSDRPTRGKGTSAKAAPPIAPEPVKKTATPAPKKESP